MIFILAIELTNRFPLLPIVHLEKILLYEDILAEQVKNGAYKASLLRSKHRDEI